MKYFILIFLLQLGSPSSVNLSSSSDFDNQLDRIVRLFVEDIMDKEKCEKHLRDADDLAEEIETEIHSGEERDVNETKKLKDLLAEAKALEYYIGAVGGVGNYVPAIGDINLANTRVRASISQLYTGIFCVDILTASIGDYKCYLIYNSKEANYAITYKWQAPDKRSSGSGSMNLPPANSRHIYDNREKPSQKNITIINITCKP